MSDDENIIDSTTKKSPNELWVILSTIIKSLIMLVIIGFIMLLISSGGAEVYTKNAYKSPFTGGWGHHEYLNSAYGLVGIIRYIVINYLGFLSYNHITNRFKNYKTIIGKVVFILFTIPINMLMSIIYLKLFVVYLFKNTLLEFFNNIIIRFGWITFPIIFLIIYIYRKSYRKQ